MKKVNALFKHSGRIAIFLACFIAWTFSVHAQSNYCDQADQAFARGKYEDAEKHYKLCGSLLNRDNSRAVARAHECLTILKKANDYFNVGDYKNALTQYEALLAKNPSDPTAKSRIATCREKLEEWAVAENLRRQREQERAAEERRQREAAQEAAEREEAERNRQAQREWQEKRELEKRAAAEAKAREEREAERIKQEEEEQERIRIEEEQERDRLREEQQNKWEAERLNKQGKEHLADKNYREAILCFFRSSGLGSAAADNNLGYMYELGLGMPHDPQKAYLCYNRSAQNGFAPAQFNLARLFESGKGVEKNLQRALELYRQAFAQGVKEAENRIKELSRTQNTR
jgi:tetratricopeptide (TPR) repeat protein